MPVYKSVNRRLGAKSVTRPIEAFKPLAALAADHAGNVISKQQIHAMQAASANMGPMFSTKSQGYDMQQRGLIQKPQPRKKKNVPGTKLLFKLQKERDREREYEIKSRYHDDLIDDITDDIMHDLLLP